LHREHGAFLFFFEFLLSNADDNNPETSQQQQPLSFLGIHHGKMPASSWESGGCVQLDAHEADVHTL
jgi:hypothetical protein